jgi:hypothetical protein
MGWLFQMAQSAAILSVSSEEQKGRCGGQISVIFGRASSSLVASRLCLVVVCSPLPSAP